MLPRPGHRRTISRSEDRLALAERGPCAATLPLPALTFASCYVYSPRATGRLAQASRQLCERVKSSDPLWLPCYAGFVYRTSFRDRQLAELFACNTVLVPVPGSGRSDATPSVAFRLAAALSGVGFALRIWPALWRRYAVTKSATAASAARPSVHQHYDSFEVERTLLPPRRILLIDDVITKGRTLLAAAARLRGELPYADVRAFAFIRTQGFVPHIERLVEPCHGVIRWAGGDARREP
jgi:hypothetical protein